MKLNLVGYLVSKRSDKALALMSVFLFINFSTPPLIPHSHKV